MNSRDPDQDRQQWQRKCQECGKVVLGVILLCADCKDRINQKVEQNQRDWDQWKCQQDPNLISWLEDIEERLAALEKHDHTAST